MVSITRPAARSGHEEPSLSRPLHFFNLARSGFKGEKSFARFRPPLILASLHNSVIPAGAERSERSGGVGFSAVNLGKGHTKSHK